MYILSFMEKSKIRQHLEFIVYELEDFVSIWDKKKVKCLGCHINVVITSQMAYLIFL